LAARGFSVCCSVCRVVAFVIGQVCVLLCAIFGDSGLGCGRVFSRVSFWEVVLFTRCVSLSFCAWLVAVGGLWGCLFVGGGVGRFAGGTVRQVRYHVLVCGADCVWQLGVEERDCAILACEQSCR